MSSARSDAEAERGAWAAAQAAAEAVLGGDDGDDAAQEDQTMEGERNNGEGRAQEMEQMAQSPRRVPNATLFIRNIPDKTTEADVRALFEQQGRS
ncbi:hypothetical protein ACHAXT_007642 [Thalassiosira profunda]